MTFHKSIVFLGLLFSGWTATALAIHPDRLTCEYIVNPLGIDVVQPRFAWTLVSNERNQFQSAYEILVSDNAADISKGIGNMWSSGKVKSSRQNHISYGGKNLQSFKRYYWRVNIYNQDDESSSSQPSWFETAMLSPDDWTASWISDGSLRPSREEDYYKDDRMPLFRKEFSASKKIEFARLYISGLGYYEAYLNGRKVGDYVLDPGWTTYRKQVLYSVHDITSLVERGKNVAGVMLGNGWWNPLPFKFFGRWDLRDFQQTGRPCVKAEIHLHFTDGTTEILKTDDTWQTAPGPIVRNNVYLGEHYDARLEQSNWNTISADKKLWKGAVRADGPSGSMSSQMQPAIKVTAVVKPRKITELQPGTFIVDMGQNFAGVARIKVKGPAGTKITLRYGEGLFDDGSLNVMTTVATQIKKGGIKGGPGAPETAWQEGNYILKGKGTEVWAARFTFHGFRYIEITGWPGTPTVDDIEGLRMNADLPVQGTFSCSNNMFNKLHEVIQWTFLSNVFSVQSDCPGREKMGYGADMVVSANAFIFNYDMANFYRKAVKDFANEQRPLGGMTEIAPFTGIDDKGYGDLSGPLGWQLAFPYLQKQLYEFYGDKQIIAEHYPALQKQISFLQSQAKDHLFYWDISDHASIDPKPESFSASLFYLHHVTLAGEFAGLLDRRDDSLKYAQLQGRIRKNIIDRFHVPGTGRFDNATQAAQLFALWYGISPEKEKSFDVLFSELERRQGHLTTGIFGTQMFFDVMRENNRNDIAVSVVKKNDFPGWGHMLKSGATTLWESWEFPETVESRNHPMFGSVDEWFYRSLLGINPAAPGFEKIIIKPQPATDLTWAKGSYHSIRGNIASEWRKEGNSFMMLVSVPVNCTAQIWIPSSKGSVVTENGRQLNAVRYEDNYAIVEVASGNYSFKSN